MLALFLTWWSDAIPVLRASDPDQARAAAIVGAVPGLSHALLFTPAKAHDPYLDDGAPPPFAMELYFTDIGALEAACAPHGALQTLAALPSLTGAQVTQQAMLARAYPVDDAATGPEPICTYLVSYTGTAEDLNVWLAYYIAHHPTIMRRFPGIRGIEICTRLDWCSFLPFDRVDYMQRNKVVFDSPDALNTALNSPVRDEMRADFKNFPPFSGGNTHFPMFTRSVVAA